MGQYLTVNSSGLTTYPGQITFVTITISYSGSNPHTHYHWHPVQIITTQQVVIIITMHTRTHIQTMVLTN